MSLDGGTLTRTPGAPWLANVSVVPADAGTLFSLPGCLSPTTSVVIPAGSPAPVFFLGAHPATVRFDALDASVLAPAQTTLQVRSGPATSLTLSMPARAQYGNCVPGFATASDSFGHAPTGRADQLTLTVSPITVTRDGGLFSGSGCVGPGVTSLAVPWPDGGRVDYSFKNGATGSFTVQGALAPEGLMANAPIVIAADPVGLAFAPALAYGYVGECTSGLVLTKKDALDGGVLFDGSEVVGLMGAGLSFYSDPSCTVQVTSLQPDAGTLRIPLSLIASGPSGAFYPSASDMAFGTANATAYMSLNRFATFSFVNTTDAGDVGSCYLATLRLADATGDAGTTTGSYLPLSSTPTGMTFFSDCTSGSTVTGASFPPFVSEATFGFRANSAGTFTMSASGPGSPTKQVSFVPKLPYGVRFSQSFYVDTVNVCVPMAVTLVDDAGVATNATAPTTVTVSSADGGTRFSTNSCGTTAASQMVTIPTGSSSFSLQMRSSVVGATQLSVQTGAWSGAATFTANNPCAGFNQGCGTTTPCCSSSPSLICGATNTCRCAFSGCIPRGGFNCGSSSNCCSGIISGTTCQ